MSVTPGNIVRIDCELTLAEGGDVIESSKKTGPVEYKHGTGQMLAGLEKRLEGMSVGEERAGVIPAAEAFGTEDSQPTMTILRDEFPKDAKVEVGAQFEAKSPQGTPVTLKVTSVHDEKIVARVVHPLAGKDVAFKVKVLSMRPPPPPVPTIEEIEPDSMREPGAISEPELEAKPEAKPDPAPEAKSESAPEAKSESEPKPEPKSESEPKPEPDPAADK